MILSHLGKKLMIRKYIGNGGWSLFAKSKQSMWWFVKLHSLFNQADMITHLLEVGEWKWK